MKIWGKLAALPVLVLVLVCLTAGAVPAVQAAEANRSNRDFSELERQIGIANGLDYYDYTKESWEVLSNAVETGNKRLSGDYEQSKLDEAAEDIEQAIKHLVALDYSPLIDALNLVYAKIDENPDSHDVWYRLDKAVDKARPLLVSGDQQAVNEMAETLKQLLAELAQYEETVVTEPEVIVEKVEVEVPPASDYCNIPMHRTWPLLLAVSALLNVLLVAALGYVLLRKRNTTDNTPLVDYDIEDDIDL